MSLKVLFVHNFYQQRGGEDSVVESEVELLRSHGHAVATYFRHNDDITHRSKAAVAKDTFWSLSAAADMISLMDQHQPDVIHVHNTFPLISPSMYWAAAKRGIPVVQTLHNFRLHCPQAMYLRNGKVCEDCLGKIPWRGALRGCYRDSTLQSSVLASMVTVHRALGTWQNKVTRYIALNEFCRSKFIEGGLPATRISIKPNFVDFDAPIGGDRRGFLFVGRLSAEKGVDVLVNAQRKTPASMLRVAGTGPEHALLDQLAGLTVLGALPMEQVRQEMSSAAALVLPSIWYENFPRTLVEAFGCGLPVIASRIGALAELVKDGQTGLLFEPGDADDLARKMRWALDNRQAMATMGGNARKQYEAEFTADRNYEQLMAIYDSAIAEAKAGRRK